LVTALCLSLLLFTNASAAATVARVVHVDNADWSTSVGVLATSPDGASIRTSDCNYGGVYTLTVPFHGTELIEHFADSLCSRESIGIATLPVLSGSATYWTEALYRDSHGNFNAVEIPELTAAPLAPSTSSRYEFYGIENGVNGKSTFIALFAGGGSTRVSIQTFDRQNKPKGDPETVLVDGFVFYELKTTVAIGGITIANIGVGVGPFTSASIDAVAFVGLREGGSPRVVLPSITGGAQ